MPDVVELITADHREVERLLEILKSQPDQRSLALPTLSALLVAHSRAEEAEVYSVARDEVGESEEIASSQHEHVKAERLLQRLQSSDVNSSEFDSTLQELIDAISHHVEEEENTVLPGLRKNLDDRRRERLGEAFAESRQEHLGERPGEADRAELLQQARNAGIEGASSMTKDQITAMLAGR